MSDEINTTIDDVFKSTPAGSIKSAAGNVFYGINHQQTHNAVSLNRDIYGLTFFVRPQLNLTDYNIRADRRFTPLTTTESASIQRIVRCYLDPRLNNSETTSVRSAFVDRFNPFIPLLTNHLISCTGWPDPVAETFTSKPGAYKEVYGYVDSNIDMYSGMDITCSFRNMSGDPITLLFYIWLNYQANVFQNIMSPYPDFIVQNEIDYNSRIYRLVLDKNKKYVQKIASVGACYPISVPLGSAFNFERDTPMNESNNTISVNFRCFGYCYNDDILVYEFNKASQIFNENMRDKYINSTMKKVPSEALVLFNNRGYPRINPKTYELEWYVSQELYARIIGEVTRHNKALEKTKTNPRTLDYSFDTEGPTNFANSIVDKITSSESIIDSLF